MQGLNTMLLGTWRYVEVYPYHSAEHTLTYEFQCNTLDYSSSGMVLVKQSMGRGRVYVTHVWAVMITDLSEDEEQIIDINLNFQCGLFKNKCCNDSWSTTLYVDGNHRYFAQASTQECSSAKSISKQKCSGDTYAPGKCSIQMTQYQKTSDLMRQNYHFNVEIRDNDGYVIRERALLNIPSGKTQSVGSLLPYTLEITAGSIDSDDVGFAYAGTRWTSSSTNPPDRCIFEDWKGSLRRGACTFTCDKK
jgi:hypothetical protein